MVSYKIALNFEDGVTRFVECGENEKVLDAAFRNRVNLPMDCSDGVCGPVSVAPKAAPTTSATISSTMR